MKAKVFGVCGAGTMGAGIAYSAALAGFEVILYDFPEPLNNGRLSIDKFSKDSVDRKKLTQEQVDTLLSRFHFVSDLEKLSDCDIIIEAIIENLQIKQDLFVKLESITNDGTILASNTSSLAITAIFSKLVKTEFSVGMHFFNPAHVMILVEVIKGYRTSEETIERVIEICKLLSKIPVNVKDTPGFIVNRVARNFYGEAFRIVSEGAATVQKVDECMKNIGFKMGPFELMDLIGIDINFAVTQSVYSQYFNEARFQPNLIQSKMVEAGLLGKKTGKGFY